MDAAEPQTKTHLSLTPALPRSAWVTLGEALQLSDLLCPSVNQGWSHQCHRVVNIK